MSRLWQLDDDLTELGEAAAAAGRLPTFRERIEALGEVFAECGVRANSYYCPDSAARQFVQWVALDFQIARRSAGRNLASV
ncbi:hypothetical protein ABZ916_25810 [Streptomyces sp. NPDC046853]|uniref:hypothetical protein n=1 Tax=Streptomyces sp. NPDC046853 TaxID=3154920 RepID=UPI0033D99C61